MSHSSKFTLPLIIALTGCGGGGEQGIGEEQIGADEKAIEIEMIAAMKDITLRRQADDPGRCARHLYLRRRRGRNRAGRRTDRGERS